MSRARRLQRSEADRRRALQEVALIAWLLDNSVPVPGTGGRRFGIDAVVGLVPGVGDLASAVIGLLVVWRGSRIGVPGIVVTRMLLNVLIDFTVGSIPFVGDAFDFWFKASSRNLELLRRHVEQPEASTSRDWLVVGGLILAVVLLTALVVWLVAQLLAALVGLFR